LHCIVNLWVRDKMQCLKGLSLFWHLWWYPLSYERALRYIEKATMKKLKIISVRCGALAKEVGYEI